MQTSDRGLRSLHAALYLVAGLILLDQFSQLAVTLFPYRIGEIQWRIAAVGVALGFATAALIADLLIFWAAAGLEHRWVMRSWAALHLLFACVGGALLGMFVLDLLDARSILPADAFAALGVNAVRAVVMALLMIVYCIFVFLFVRSRFPKVKAQSRDRLVASHGERR